MSYIEADYQDHMIDELRTYGARAISFVGNRYLSGEPDIEVTSKFGAIVKIEFKLWRKTSLPTKLDITHLLDGPQIKVVNELWRRNAPMLMIAGFAEIKGKSAIVNKSEIVFANDIEIVRKLANAPFGTFPYSPQLSI